MDAKHTPGPWVTCDAHGPIENGYCVKWSKDDYMIASCTSYYPRAVVIANARLIAAAPDLLEACIAAKSGDPLAYQLLPAAIAKATGAA